MYKFFLFFFLNHVLYKNSCRERPRHSWSLFIFATVQVCLGYSKWMNHQIGTEEWLSFAIWVTRLVISTMFRSLIFKWKICYSPTYKYVGKVADTPKSLKANLNLHKITYMYLNYVYILCPFNSTFHLNWNVIILLITSFGIKGLFKATTKV